MLPGSGTRQQGVSDYLDDAAYGEELTPEELAELAEEQGSLSNSNTARGGAASGSAVAQQRSSTTSAGNAVAMCAVLIGNPQIIMATLL